MKKWIMSSFLIILMVIIMCTAGAIPAVQSESLTMWDEMLFSYVKEQCTETETDIITKPWVTFMVQSSSTDILTLEMKNNNNEKVNLYLKYNNYLASLNVDNHVSEPDNVLICATQIYFNSSTEYIAIAGDEGLYIWWEQGNTFLPYNNCLIINNAGATFYNESFMHLNCTAIKCTGIGIVEKASSNNGDTLYAATDGFQYESHSRHDLKLLLYVIVFSLGILLFGSITMILIFKKTNISKKKRRKNQGRKKKQEKHNTNVDLDDNLPDDKLTDVESDYSEDMAYDESDDYESESDNNYAANEESSNNNNMGTVDECVIDLMPLYSTITEYTRALPYMQSYNLDNNQIIVYMKSREKASLNVRLLPSGERNSIFLLLDETVLLVNPLWINSWNRSKLFLDPLWYNANSIQYVYEIRSSNNILIDISEVGGEEIYDIVPPEISKIGETLVVIRKGIFYM